MNYEGFTKKMKDSGKKPLYSMRSIIKGIEDPKYEKLRNELRDPNRKKDIVVYSLQEYEPDEVSITERKKYLQNFVDYANFISTQDAHYMTDILLGMTDPTDKNIQNREWPFYTMCQDIDSDTGFATDIIVVKKGDKNYR